MSSIENYFQLCAVADSKLRAWERSLSASSARAHFFQFFKLSEPVEWKPESMADFWILRPANEAEMKNRFRQG